jgi:multidrug transporter EmrE-like cation transporter
MAWLILVTAALLEFVWALALKHADGFTDSGQACSAAPSPRRARRSSQSRYVTCRLAAHTACAIHG